MSTTSTPPFDLVASWGRYFQGFELSAGEAQVLGYLFLSGGGTVDAVVAGIGRSTSTVRVSLRILSHRDLVRQTRAFGAKESCWMVTSAVTLLPVDALRRRASALRLLASIGREEVVDACVAQHLESCAFVADLLEAGAADIEARYAQGHGRR